MFFQDAISDSVADYNIACTKLFLCFQMLIVLKLIPGKMHMNLLLLVESYTHFLIGQGLKFSSLKGEKNG